MANLSQEVSLIVFVAAFLLLVAIGIITLVLVYQKRQTQFINEKKQVKAAFEKELLEAQVEMQEQTLKNISQEIHDNIGQTLSLAKLHLIVINPEGLTGTVEKMANARELVTKAIADLRLLSKTLHTEAVLSAGLVRTIEMELAQIDRASVFKTAFSVTGSPASLDAKKELILFRTIQEALNNAIKHSGASLISIHLAYHPRELQVMVHDDGKGFNRALEEAGVDRGSGLRNMQNRTKLIEGSITIQTNALGTTIQIIVPITA